MTDLVVSAPRRPLPGETLVGTRFETFLGGKGFNQAIAAARFGAHASIVGRVGEDEFGAAFIAALDREGIDRRHVRVDSRSGTGVGLPLVEPSGENSIVIVPHANAAVDAGDMRAAAPVIEDAEVLLLQLELPLVASVEAARIARRAGRLVVLNPAPATGDLGELMGLIDVLVPNQVEAGHIFGNEVAPGEFDDAAGLGHALVERFGCSVVLTLGANGVVVVEAGRTAARIAAHHVEVVDTVGAGDAFCGVLGAVLADGNNLQEASVVANAAAALAVTCRGAEPSLPERVDVERLLTG